MGSLDLAHCGETAVMCGDTGHSPLSNDTCSAPTRRPAPAPATIMWYIRPLSKLQWGPGSPSPGLSDLPHSANVWGNTDIKHEHNNLCPAPDNLQIKFQFARHCVRWPGCRVIPLILLQNTMQIESPGSRLQTSICKVASLDHNSAPAWLGWAGLDQGQFNHCVVCLLCEARRDRRVIKC